LPRWERETLDKWVRSGDLSPRADASKLSKKELEDAGFVLRPVRLDEAPPFVVSENGQRLTWYGYIEPLQREAGAASGAPAVVGGTPGPAGAPSAGGRPVAMAGGANASTGLPARPAEREDRTLDQLDQSRERPGFKGFYLTNARGMDRIDPLSDAWKAIGPHIWKLSTGADSEYSLVRVEYNSGWEMILRSGGRKGVDPGEEGDWVFHTHLIKSGEEQRYMPGVYSDWPSDTDVNYLRMRFITACGESPANDIPIFEAQYKRLRSANPNVSIPRSLLQWGPGAEQITVFDADGRLYKVLNGGMSHVADLTPDGIVERTPEPDPLNGLL
jgi:hypothetical protein